MIATNANLKTVLVIGVYMRHKLTDANDPTIFFYGDGAGAAVLERSDKPGFISSAFRADGSYAPRWAIFAGGTVEPVTEESLKSGHTRVKMYDRYPPEINNDGWPMIVRDCHALTSAELPGSDGFTRSPHARTAVGESKDGTTVYFVVVNAPGVTLGQLAAWMSETSLPRLHEPIQAPAKR